MEPLIFDTTFLIDFARERKHGKAGAHLFLDRHLEHEAYIPAIVIGEFGEGFESTDDRVYRSVIGSFEILPVTEEVATIYASITRHLRRAGLLIGSNDLWIAATSLSVEFTLVTRNRDHFARVPDLRVQTY